MVDDFEGIRTAFSLGVGHNVDWDVAIARRGITVHQFDHTVVEPPRSHPGCHFHKRRISEVKEDDAETLESIFDLAATCEPASALLKMDIENTEWPAFAAAPEHVLDRFSQILCEFHAFEFFADDVLYRHAAAAITKLRRQFDVVHVHGNNVADWTFIDGAPLPFVIEVALVNRRRVRTVPNDTETFPTRLDRPNDWRKADYFLGRYEFPSPDDAAR
ncbi:hypothetical protein tb265_28020 [Gemmatimonadetes bacterium T265]|nr:hypothetical protein tb265_28020 [Gemmatimonadetes bacterium T265]